MSRIRDGRRSAYFWLMLFLYTLLALGLCLWVVGLLTGQPAAFGPPEAFV